MHKINARLTVFIVLVFLTSFGAFLRTARLSEESAWYDEILTLQVLDEPNLFEFLKSERKSDPATTPVYFAVAYVWSRLVSQDDFSMRMLSVVIGLVTIPLMYLLSRLFYGTAASLVATAALCCSLIHIYHSQEVRVYALVVLLALGSMYSFIKLVKTESCQWWSAYGVCSALLTFTQFLSILILPVQFLYLLMYHRRKRLISAWICMQMAIGALLFGWLLPVFGMSKALGKWMPGPSWKTLGHMLRVYCGASPGGWVGTDLTQSIVLICMSALVVTYLLQILVRKISNRSVHPEEVSKAVFLMLWLVVPISMLALLSVVWKPVFVLRYTLYCILPLYILLGGAVAAPITGKWRVVLRLATVLVMLGAWGYQLAEAMKQPLRANFRVAGKQLALLKNSEDVVLTPDCFKIALGHHFSELKSAVRGPFPPPSMPRNVEAIHTEEGKDVWCLLSEGHSLWQFEDICRARGLAWNSIHIAGCPPLVIYHFPCPEERPLQTAGMQPDSTAPR